MKFFRLRNSLPKGKRREGLDACSHFLYSLGASHRLAPRLLVVCEVRRVREEYSEDSLDAEAKVKYEETAKGHTLRRERKG